MPAGSHRRRTLLLASLLACTAVTVRAGDPPSTEFYRSLLPRWCRFAGSAALDTRQLSQTEIAQVYGYVKSGCQDLGRYCQALDSTNRGHIPDRGAGGSPASHFAKAITNYEAIVQQSKPGCSLLPDIFTRIGALETELGKAKEAEVAFRKALTLKPSYTAAYTGLSDLYESAGAIDQARAVLEAGLKANPQSDTLKKKRARLEARTGSTPAAP